MDLHTVCFTLFLLTFTGVCFGQQLLLPEEINGTVGEDVVITPLRIPDLPYSIIRWKFKEIQILYSDSNRIIIFPPYTDRVTLNTITLALTLRSLTESDTGTYSLTVNTLQYDYINQTSLHVLAPVSNVTITPSKTELIEFNSTVSLICTASGSSPSFIWLNGSSAVTAGEQVQLTDSNRNLTFNTVIRYDAGPYQCQASNSISNAKSSPLSLTIYYGPENVSAVVNEVEPIYSSGSNLTLTCSAVSSPAAEFQWVVNGSVPVKTCQMLELSNIQSSQSGNYTCRAHNKKSLRYGISEPISITVVARASNVIIVPNKKEVELNSTVSLVCSASGSTLSFKWLNGSNKVTAGERVQLTDHNSNLTITNVIRDDVGPYTCEASNSVSRATSLPFTLTIVETSGGEGPLSAGAIAGIVIGGLLGIAAVAGLIFYFVKGKEISETTTGNKQNGATPNEGQHELHYADINHFRHNQRHQEVSAIPNAQAASSYGPQYNKKATSNTAAPIIYSDVRNK